MAGNHKSGRRRKPTEIKLVQGTFREDRHGAEITVPAEWPAPPAYIALTERQATIWGGLKGGDAWHAKTDWPAVLGLVKALDELIQNQEAQRETETSGHPLSFKHVIKHVVDAKGDPTELEIVSPEENPLKGSEMKWLDRLYKFIALNGYSPVDRAKMPSATEIKPANPLERFLKRPSK